MGMLLFGIAMISLGTIHLYLTQKFNLDALTVGSLAALLPLGILAGSVIFGPLVDRFGYRFPLIIFTLILILGIEMIALTEWFFTVQLAFFLIGFGGGVINGGTNALVSDISTGGKGANLSLLGVFFGIGALGMPAVLQLLSRYFETALVVRVIGLVICVPVVYFSLIRFPEPKQRQGFPVRKSLALFRDYTIVMLGLVLFFQSGVEGIVNNWTTSFLKNGFEREVLFALSVYMASLTIARLVLGVVLKKVHSYLVLVGSIAIAILGSLILMVATRLTIALSGLILLGFGFAAVFPVIYAYVGTLYAEISGTAFSFVLVIALTGNTLLNYLTGAVSNSGGIQLMPLILLGALVIMFTLVVIVIGQIVKRAKLQV